MSVALAVAVVLLAAVLRLGWLDLAQFQSDESTWLRIAEDWVRLGRLPLDGPLSSQGIPQAPHFEYFLAAAVAVSREPLVATAAVALLNVLGVAGTVWLGWRAFGPLAGLVAGLLFAVGPGAVFYARKIWPPDVVPPLGVLLMIALDYGVVHRRAGWAAASLPIGVLGSLSHFGFVVLTPLLLAPAVVLVRGRHWPLLLLGALASVLITTPYLVHHVQTGFEDIKNFRYYASSVPVVVDPQALGYGLSLAAGWGGLRVADVLSPGDAGLPAAVWDGVALLATLLLGASVVLAAWQVARGGLTTWPANRIRLAGLLLWLALPVIATTRHSLALQPHYYLALLPAPYLLIGMLCQWLLGRQVRAVLGAALAAAGVVAVVQLVADGRLLDFVATQYEPCYGAPMRLTEDIGRQAIVFGAGASHASVENEAGDADSIAYVLRGAVPRVDLAGVGGVGVNGQAAAVEPTGRSVLDATQPLDLSFAPGVRATAASVSDDVLQGGRVRFALDWLVDETTSWARPLVWEVRVTNAAGQVVQQASGIDHIPTSMPGEHVLSWFTLDTPREIEPGPYQARLRLIDADRGVPLAFVGAEKSTADEWTSLPFSIGQTPRCRG